MTAEELNMMIQEITVGVTKADSLVIRSGEDAALWDTLAADIAEIKARGHIVDIPFETPSVDVVDPAQSARPE